MMKNDCFKEKPPGAAPPKLTYAKLKELQAWPIEDKIERAGMLIRSALVKNGAAYVALSWGKDSVVVADMVLKACPHVTLMFNNTGVEYPETYEYRDLMLKEWEPEQYLETKPIKTFWECLKEYGSPEYRSKARTPKCCHYLKEKPAKDAIKAHGFELCFDGLMAEESYTRKAGLAQYGELHYVSSWKIWKAHPLAIWTEADVWAYHDLHNLQRNKIYERSDRNGCMPCSGFIGWEAKLARENPAMYKLIQKQKGQSLLI